MVIILTDRVTIAWYDGPSVSGTSTRTLINDLDLTVSYSPHQKVFYGNGGSSPDRGNTNERVYVAEPEMGLWTVG